MIDQERDRSLDTFKQKHKQEALAAKAAEKMIASIREHAHCKIEDAADGLDQERDALMDAFKQKHKQEARAKAAAALELSEGGALQVEVRDQRCGCARGPAAEEEAGPRARGEARIEGASAQVQGHHIMPS